MAASEDADDLNEILGSPDPPGVETIPAAETPPTSSRASSRSNGGSNRLCAPTFSSSQKSPKSGSSSSARAKHSSPRVSTGGQHRNLTPRERLEAILLEEQHKARLIAGSFRAREYNPKTPSPPKVIIANKRAVTVAEPFSFRNMPQSESARAKFTPRREEKEQRKAQTTPSFKSRSVPRTTYEYEPISKFRLTSTAQLRLEKVRQLKEEEIKKKEKESKGFYNPVPKSTYESPKPISPREEEAIRRFEAIKQKRLEEQRQREENDITPRRRRPVPITTYSPKPILAEKEEKAMRDAALAREKRLEEQRIREEQKRQEEEGIPHKPRPVPPTTYSPKHILAEKEEKAMRDAALAREKKLEEQRKIEAEKILAEEAEFKVRPVPSTTYKPNPISPEKLEKALMDAALVREQKLQKIHQEEEAKYAQETFTYKPRPIPKTTYEPKPISPKVSVALHIAEEIGQKKRTRHADGNGADGSFRARSVRKSQCTLTLKDANNLHGSEKSPNLSVPSTSETKGRSFRARPVPKSTYDLSAVMSPKRPAPKRTSAKKPVTTDLPPKEAATGKPTEYHFHARPLPKTTYMAPVSPKRPASTSKRPSTDSSERPESKKHDHASEPSEENIVFHARSVPKTTYEPVILSPKVTTPVAAAKKSADTKPTVSTFRARPVPITTYKAEVKPKQPKPTIPARKVGSTSVGSSSTSKSSSSFRARPVPKSTYVAEPLKKAANFRPISTPAKSPRKPSESSMPSNVQDRAMPKSTHTNKPADTKSISENNKPSPPGKGPSSINTPGAKRAPGAFVDAPFAYGCGEDADENSKLAEAILSDEDAAEITFEKDENAQDDNELTAILGGLDPWTATAEQDEEAIELDAILGH